MSGGHFDYKQHQINDIVDEIEQVVLTNDYSNYSKKTIQKFQKAIDYLKLAYIYTHRIDWLLSGDDGEETFHERLKEELDKEKNK